jgi:hypothetical protein
MPTPDTGELATDHQHNFLLGCYGKTAQCRQITSSQAPLKHLYTLMHCSLRRWLRKAQQHHVHAGSKQAANQKNKLMV